MICLHTHIRGLNQEIVSRSLLDDPCCRESQWLVFPQRWEGIPRTIAALIYKHLRVNSQFIQKFHKRKFEMATSVLQGPTKLRLVDLPGEILTMIFKHFYRTFDLKLSPSFYDGPRLQTSPMNLVLTCRRLSQLALDVSKQDLNPHLDCEDLMLDNANELTDIEAMRPSWLLSRIQSMSLLFDHCSLDSGNESPLCEGFLSTFENLSYLHITHCYSLDPQDMQLNMSEEIDLEYCLIFLAFAKGGRLSYTGVLNYQNKDFNGPSRSIDRRFENAFIQPLAKYSSFLAERGAQARIDATLKISLPAVVPGSPPTFGTQTWKAQKGSILEVMREFSYSGEHVMWTKTHRGKSTKSQGVDESEIQDILAAL